VSYADLLENALRPERWAKIKWAAKRIPFRGFDSIGTLKHSFLDQLGFYAIVSGDYVLYVGIAWKKGRTLRKRITEPHDSYEAINGWLGKNDADAEIMLGALVDCPQKRPSKQLREDAERVLILDNDVVFGADYEPREDMHVENVGSHRPFERVSAWSSKEDE